MIVSRLKERRKLHRHREQFISTPAAKSDVRRAALTTRDGSSLDLRPDVSWQQEGRGHTAGTSVGRALVGTFGNSGSVEKLLYLNPAREITYVGI